MKFKLSNFLASDAGMIMACAICFGLAILLAATAWLNG
jgi:hypothetical protein